MLCRLLRSPGSRCIVLALVLLGLAGMVRAQQNAPFFYAYDEDGRLVGVVDAAGNTTTYTYDAVGNIGSIVRGSGPVSILEFSPNSGPVGTQVTITGAGFSATASQNAVTFNNVSASVVSTTPNRLVAVVPAGATTGPIRVTSPAGAATSSSSFTVGAGTAPTIGGFTPTIGAPGTAVTITGTNFETAAGGNKASFNGNLGTVSSSTATTINAAVPATATSGHISVTTPNGRATSTGDFFVPPAPYTAADVDVTGRMAIGGTANATISVAGRIGLILFDGAAGQRIALSVALGTGVSGGGCDTVSIRRPEGAYLVSSTSICGSSGFVDLQVLPVTGTYTIAFDPAGTEIGTATLTLHDVPPDASSPIVPGGSPATLTTTVPGQNAKATFSGVAGKRVSLNVAFGTGLDTSTCNTVSIQNPDGTALLSPTNQCGASYFTDALVLPAAGTYTITINPGGTNVGSATLTLYDVPPDVSPSIVPGGAPVGVTITTPGQNAQVTFSGTAGQRVSLNVAFGGLDTSTCNTVSVQNPDGTALLSPTNQCGASYFSDTLTLATAGTYTITINPGGMNVGTATLTLYDIPADASPTLVPGGAPVDVIITTPGQNAQVTFSGNLGQRVSLNVVFGGLDTSTCNTVSIQNPDGTALLSPTNQCGASYFTDTLVLPATGTYTITINPGGMNVGTATLTLYDVPADASPVIVPGGSPVGVTITTPGQNAQVTFSGTAGQRVSLNVAFGGLDTSTCNTVSIQKPDGTALLNPTCQSGATYFTDVLALSVTGTYTITLNPGGMNVGTATLTLYDVPPDASPAIVPGGSPVDVTITTPGQNAQVTFGGAAGQRVSLNVAFGGLDTATCNTVSIQKPDGTALLNPTCQSGATYFTDVLTLSAAGTYTITLNPGGLNTGTATLTLYDVPADVTATITVNGSAAPVTTTVPGQNAVVSFDGTAGQSVTVRITGNTMGSVAVTLRKPDGSTQASSSSSAASFNLATQTLPVTGTYTILVNPSGTNTGSINVATTSP